VSILDHVVQPDERRGRPLLRDTWAWFAASPGERETFREQVIAAAVAQTSMQ